MNNKKRSLAKAKIVINIDFPTELLKQYTLYEESIIIDLTQNIKIVKKRFNGTIITNYEISLKNKQIYKKEDELFFTRDLYEAEFYKKQPYKYNSTKHNSISFYSYFFLWRILYRLPGNNPIIIGLRHHT